jgi:hypothetical protein
MAQAHQGIVKDAKGQEQPADKKRAQTVHKTDPEKPVSTDAARDEGPGHGDGKPVERRGRHPQR